MDEYWSDDGEIDLRRMAGRLWKRKAWIIAAVVAFTVAFAATAFLMDPVYRATTLSVAANSDRDRMGSLGSALGQFAGLAALAGVNLGSADAQTEEALAVMRSREFTEGFIRERQLTPDLFANRWDPKRRTWKIDAERPTLAQAFKRFDKDVRTVSRDKKTGLISVSIEWHDPVKAAQWANALVERLNAEMRARAIANTTASIGYLQKELAATSTVETRESINRLMEAQINQRMLANVTDEYALRIVDKALPPDPKDVVRPKKPLMLLLGPTLGAMCGIFLVLVTSRRKPRAIEGY